MYDHTRQYRCDIIRGKSKKEMDDLLPAYAKVVNEICPCKAEEFESKFNSAFGRFLPETQRVKKTLDNHRTEISGKLFGMYFFSNDGMVYESQRTQKFLEDNDQPAFFKDICYKMQFPNGMQKTLPTVVKRVEDKICIRPNAFVLKLLTIAEIANVEITRNMIAYYVLNSLDVLSGTATPYEVLEAIVKDKNEGIHRKIQTYDEEGNEKAYSYRYQHIKEQLNYLELANLIRLVECQSDRTDSRVILNSNERTTIDIFIDEWNAKPIFDVAAYDLGTIEGRRKFQMDWDFYYSQLSEYAGEFETTAASLIVEEEQGDTTSNRNTTARTNLTEFGDEGEEYVFNYEKARVAAYSQRLANKVLSLGKTRGLGYDIQSVIAEPGDMDEFVKYIEVKSTKRLTVPDINDSLWVDTLNITRNEWVAAQQHGAFYSIFRVYFTRNGVTVFVLNNIADKCREGKLQIIPMTYRIDFSRDCVDCVVS